MERRSKPVSAKREHKAVPDVDNTDSVLGQEMTIVPVVLAQSVGYT